ncbi:MAG TPA: hypothetical protein VFU31_11820 [Candidatus Binatia bacterium]|nr:hypothetical protein [Candidatus Binatia bacterium]
MRLPIFGRLLVGYMAIMLMAAAVASYAIVQLGGLSATARTALNTDNRMIAYGDQMTDAFLSEVRYAGRFIITHSSALHGELRQFKNDFLRYLNEIKSLAPSAEIQGRLSRVEELHLRYHDLFDQEVRYIKARQPYSESRYQQEREKILESGLRELERLKAQLQKNLHDKLETMDRAARSARTVAAVTTLILLALGVALSLGISNSITGPLSTLRRSMASDAENDCGPASELSQIPEIRELFDAVTRARMKIDKTAKVNAAFIQSIDEYFGTPLISLKKRLAYLKGELGEKVTPEQRTSFEVLTEETERLIENCAQLNRYRDQQVKELQIPTALGPGTEESRPQANIDWMTFWSDLQSRMNRSLRLFTNDAQSLLVWVWGAVCHSIKVGWGKVKNHEERRSK